jgi:crotonobetainyl-CoA:carnitine CoA-transferase CaiB-like acyl-CoA transferase
MTYQALAGIRVVDLGIVTAGASTSAVLADLGADVIKVEGPAYTDPFREWTGINEETEWWNESPQFQATNRNKRSVCLDLKSEAGLAQFMKLVANSDIVLENFRSGVLKRLKLDFEELVKVNPKIILASISSQGQTGPEREKSSFGSTLEASSGMASLMRYDGGRPQITGKGLNYPDQVASLFSASAIMAALIERKRTGCGIALDLSQRELTSFLIGEALVAAAEGLEAPHQPARAAAYLEGVFQARDEQWLAVTVAGDTPAASIDGMNAPLAHPALAQWIGSRPADEAAASLRQAGAAAEVVWTARNFRDPAAIKPETAFALDSDGHQVKGLPLRLGNRDFGVFQAAPALGRDNETVAREVMGLSTETYAALVSSGVFSDRPTKAAKASR